MFEKIKEHPPKRMRELQCAVTKWVVLDSLPFNMMKGNGFKQFMKEVDPRFCIPNNKTIKNLIAKAYILQKKNLINLIKETCDTATITTDLWTARSKVGYIGVTCHWLTPDFELIDVLLAIEKMPYSQPPLSAPPLSAHPL
jgi:hypothetical protein